MDEDQKLQKKKDDAPKFPFEALCPIYNIKPGSYKYNKLVKKEGLRAKTLISEEELERLLRKRGYRIERR